jgi:hypothetical protein
MTAISQPNVPDIAEIEAVQEIIRQIPRPTFIPTQPNPLLPQVTKPLTDDELNSQLIELGKAKDEALRRLPPGTASLEGFLTLRAARPGGARTVSGGSVSEAVPPAIAHS